MGKRIALLGNCQTEVLKDCLEALTGAEITLYPFAAAETAANVEQIADGLAGFDAVVSHSNPSPALARLRPEALSPSVRVLSIPSIMFTGYHPDFQTGLGLWPRSPLGIFHSAVVLGCFLGDIPEHRVRAMFNSYTYARLGYFAEFGKAQAFLLRASGELGFDLSGCLSRWGAAGSFMHSPNHPKVHVLADLARLIADKLGLPFDPTMPVEDYVEDRLLVGVRPAGLPGDRPSPRRDRLLLHQASPGHEGSGRQDRLPGLADRDLLSGLRQYGLEHLLD
jgi:hypothetical protein